jgi:colicin import membrane protein
MSLSKNPGLVVSSAAHVTLLAAALLSFSFDPKFQDAQETIPIEMVSASELNQIMRGDKTAKEVQPKQRVDKIAETTEIKPKPPLAEAKRDVPTPPSPDKKLPDPGETQTTPQKPIESAAPTPKPPVVESPQQDAAADDPLPTPRPKVDPPKKEAKKDEPKKPEPPKLKLDQIAKLLDEKTPKDPPKLIKPKSGDESTDHHKFDPDEISRLVSHETPQRKAATGRELEQVASLGAPTGTAPRLSPSLQAQMEGWFQDRFQGCWTQPITVPPGRKYVPEIRVPLNLDGSLAGEPTLLNPPSDSAWQPLAESALRAVHKCDPLPVPAQFKPYYAEWRGRIVRFNDDAL